MNLIRHRGILRSATPPLAFALLCVTVIAARGQSREIDRAKSQMTIHVYAAGMLSAFGHEHEITAPVANGAVDGKAGKVELHVNAADLRVQDPKASDKDRNQVQENMLGPEVLDAGTYKEITFQSTSAAPAGEGAWKVSGNLKLHGQARPVSVDVREKDGHYTGSCQLNITSFGIKPVKVAGGTIRVKDQIKIEFDIQLAR
jgi:polyisoprenoid-binding protein YceI